jgi:hypothetical protein
LRCGRTNSRPDELENKPVSAQIAEVLDQMTLKDDGAEIRLYRILNPHVEALSIGYVVKPNIVWATDLLSASGDPRPRLGPCAPAFRYQ